MAVENSRIVEPYFPSLFHISLVNVSIPLFHNFHPKTLDAILQDIQSGNSSVANEGSHGNINVNYNRARTHLLWIPGHFRKAVLEAVYAFHYACIQWRFDHLYLFSVGIRKFFMNYNDEKETNSRFITDLKRIFYWRPDGTIDRIKTAKQFVLNSSINARDRFGIACMYCLVESIQTLWAQVAASGRTEDFEVRGNCNSMVPFWAGWMRNGSVVPWMEAAREFLEDPNKVTLIFRCPIAFSSFFPLLSTGARKKFLPLLRYATYDDLRFCLYSMTREEASQVLRGMGLSNFLHLHLNWPLQGLLLQVAEKAWDALEVKEFWSLVVYILEYERERKDYDYSKLFELVWKKSPNHLKEAAKALPFVCKRGYTLGKQVKRRGKIDHDRTKKCIRKNGRLQ